MCKSGIKYLLLALCAMCAFEINAQITVTFEAAPGAFLCRHGNTPYPLTLDPTAGNPKNVYRDNSSTTTLVAWNAGLLRWEVSRGNELIAYNETETTSDPPCFSAGGWVSDDNFGLTLTRCALANISGPSCDVLACDLQITQNIQNQCVDNGSYDYYSITINANATYGSTHYQVVLNGVQLGPNTPYGTSVTVGDGINGPIGTFTADGTTTYSLVIRDASDHSCSSTYNTVPVESCFTGPLADYVMGREKGTISTCGGSFADSGDLNGAYGSTEEDTLTFCSDNFQQLSVSFINFNLEESSDLLYIYDGPDITSPQVDGSPFSNYGSESSPGSLTSTGTCLTFRFTSNGSVESLGWNAELQCTGSPDNFIVSNNWNGYPYSDTCMVAQIGGTIFNDISNDGNLDLTDIGIPSVSVSLYGNNGFLSSTTTDNLGEYVFNGLHEDSIYRIEFEVPDGLEVGGHGMESSSTIQFARGNLCDVNLGMYDPANFCSSADPKWVIPCYINGASSHSSNATSTGVAKFDYSASGNAPAASYENEIETQRIGSTWGVAYKRSTEEIYLASMLKRHSGLGPNGIGAIYSHVIGSSNTDVDEFYNFGSSAGSVISEALRFPGTGDEFGEVGPCGACDNTDESTFAQIGKVGFGDIDISTDEDTLYVVNLFDRKVYSITTNNPAPGSATELPNQPWINNSPCSNGIARPWALKVRRNKLYVGLVCDASSSGCNNLLACNDLTASVYSYNLSTKIWNQELTFPLNYYRDPFVWGSPYWVKWSDDYTSIEAYVKNVTDAQMGCPIFADIEFDDDGSIIMGFGDRTTLQLGYQAPSPDQTGVGTGDRAFVHGDVLRAFLNPNTGNFELENNGVVGDKVTTNPANLTGIGGKSFYWGDFWSNGDNNAGIGGLAIKWGSQEVMFPVADPINTFSNGLVWMNSNTGEANRTVEIYRGDALGQASSFAKGSGVGDLEILCDPAPIELGNYVWWDEDQDGLMDPGEKSIPNVAIELFKDPNGNTANGSDPDGDEFKAASTITDDYGRYVFSFDGNDNNLEEETWTNGESKVEADMVYQIRIPDYQNDQGLRNYKYQNDLASLSSTSYENQGVSGSKRDNNGSVHQEDVVATVMTSFWGKNDHSIDFGFIGEYNCVKPLVTVKSNVPCEGDTLLLTTEVSGINGPFTYNWSGPQGFTSTLANPVIPSSTSDNQGTYFVTVTDQIGCTDTLKINAYVHTFSSSAVVSDNTCSNSNGAIDVTASGLEPILYNWSHLPGNNNPEDLSGLDGGEYWRFAKN